MASTRLTNNIRESLKRKLLKRAFQKRVQDHIKRCSDFALRVYRDAFKADLAKMEALPKGWLPTDNDIAVHFGGEQARPKFCGSLGGWSLPEMFTKAGGERVNVPDQRFPAERKGKVNKTYDARDPFTEEFRKLQGEQEDLVKEIQGALNTMSAAMNSVSTVGKLIEVWPEVKDFAEQYLVDGERKAVLPAIPRDKLNTILNLPPEGAEA